MAMLGTTKNISMNSPSLTGLYTASLKWLQKRGKSAYGRSRQLLSGILEEPIASKADVYNLRINSSSRPKGSIQETQLQLLNIDW